jgi:hypothetical protein
MLTSAGCACYRQLTGTVSFPPLDNPQPQGQWFDPATLSNTQRITELEKRVQELEKVIEEMQTPAQREGGDRK